MTNNRWGNLPEDNEPSGAGNQHGGPHDGQPYGSEPHDGSDFWDAQPDAHPQPNRYTEQGSAASTNAGQSGAGNGYAGQSGTAGHFADGAPSKEPDFDEAEDVSTKKTFGFKLLAIAAVLILIIGVLITVVTNNRDDDSDDVAAGETVASETEETSETSTTKKPKKTTEPETTSEEPTEAATLSIGQRCDETNVAELTGFDSVMFCDGDWLYAGRAQSDFVRYYQWDENQQMWEEFESDGTTATGFLCYNDDRVDAAGVPAALKSKMTMCNSKEDRELRELSEKRQRESNRSNNRGNTISSVNTNNGAQSAASVSCDGTNVLIVYSVIGGKNSATENELAGALNSHPGASFTQPGACSSLRGQTDDGAPIYPVFYEYDSQADMCAAKTRMGGNARTLNNNADFSDPC